MGAFWFLFKQIHICITHCKRFRFRSPQHLQEKRYHSMSSRTATNRNEGASESLRVVALRSASCASETFMSDSSACEKHSDASGFVEQFFLRVVQVVSYNALNPGTARSPPSIQAFHVLSLHGVARNRVGARELHCFTMMEWQCPATFGVSHARCRYCEGLTKTREPDGRIQL